MSTPTATVLARRWRLEVDMSAAQDGSDFQLFPAVTDFNWTAEPNHEDSSVYEDGGWAGNTKTGQAWEVVATCNRKATADSTAYSAVHEKVRAAFFAFGDDSQVRIRWMDRDGLPEAYEGTALVTWAPQGGERTALDQVQVTFTGNGPLEQITNPLAA
ncbi:hypothetical protein RM780_04025 [Streptomyces sp. DSM 44917]|uniref:Phage tail protein n=1 Tax=Streptomyces boetiae TaxID=3075541 RepID=A0ABU2L3K0_9ACTN|nr:hypothetical protein [Streptomyces sp. DSM 44917]MDT0306130.1 hypothetical protein [Streptomyces sp. DSM 44917]